MKKLKEELQQLKLEALRFAGNVGVTFMLFFPLLYAFNHPNENIWITASVFLISAIIGCSFKPVEKVFNIFDKLFK